MARKVQNSILEELESAIENSEEIIQSSNQSSYMFHDWSTETINVNTLLRRYKEERFILPLCQRLYVWDEKKRYSLLKSIKQNLPCGNIILAEIDGVKYLVDGLQRTTSLMLLSNDKKLSDDDKKMVLNYKISVVTVLDMTLNSMKEYFAVLNSGVKLAAIVKERAALSDDLNNAVLLVASSANNFFRDAHTSAVFNKSHHHELIAMNTLLAVSGIGITDIKARALREKIESNEELVLQNIEAAQDIIVRLANIYKNINKKIEVRSLKATFINSLVYIMVDKPEYSNQQIRRVIETIFADRYPIEEYAATTSENVSSVKNCIDRCVVIMKYLENPMVLKFDEKGFKKFLKKYKDTNITDSTGKITIPSNILDTDDFKKMYNASIDEEMEMWDKVIAKRHEEFKKYNLNV